MKVLFVLMLVTSSFVWAQDVRVDDSGSPVEAKFAAGGRIRLDLCPSGAEVDGTDDSIIRVTYYPEHDGVRVRINGSGNRADVVVTGCPHGNFKIKIEIPKTTGLYARMMAGQLDVRDVTGDKDVEISFGQLNIDMGQSDQYGRIDASVYSGQVNAAAFRVSKGGLFRSFDEHGPGKYKLHAHVGAGQVDLR